jgi:hypothetical protein
LNPRALIVSQIRSIGFKSGESGGKYFLEFFEWLRFPHRQSVTAAPLIELWHSVA